MIDESELRRMSPEERARVARALAAAEEPASRGGGPRQWRRRLGVAAALACCVVLAAWIGVLAVTLPGHYRVGGWRAGWVGFDIALFVAFLATAWAAWRRRQVLILCLIVLASLLCCDAWFDTTLDWGTRGFVISLLSALLVELPVAAVALLAARRLLRLTLGRLEKLEGEQGPTPSLWRVPLFGEAGGGYRDLLLQRTPKPAPAPDDASPGDVRRERGGWGAGAAPGRAAGHAAPGGARPGRAGPRR